MVHPQNKNSVLVASKENFNSWNQKGFGKKSLFTKNRIYDFDIIPEKNQTVEQYLGFIESNMSVVLQKLKAYKELSEEDYFFLSVFIVSLINRTSENMKQFQDLIKNMHDYFEALDVTQNKKYTKEYFKGFEDAAKIRILNSAEIVKKSHFIQESFYFLYNMSNINFITSDNPVIIEHILKNEIEKILKFPVLDKIPINRKSIILPITPNLCVLYCDYLDKKGIDKYIRIFDDNIIFKINMLQLRNCENIIISNVDNSQIDYAQCYKALCNSNHTRKLIFVTESNRYMLKSEVIDHTYFQSKIKIYDIKEFYKIIKHENIISIQACDNSFGMKIQNFKILNIKNEHIMIKIFI